MPPALDISDGDQAEALPLPLNGTVKGRSNGKLKKRSGLRFDTLQVHSGHEDVPGGHNPCTLPIYNTVAFGVSSEDNDFFTSEGYATTNLYIYSRVANPTNAGLERRIAALEKGIGAVSFSSGSAAVLGVIMSLAAIGDNIVVSRALFGGTYDTFHKSLPLMGIEVRFCDITAPLSKIRRLIDDKTKLIFTESISNPSLMIPDLEGLASVAHAASIPFVVDATWTAAGYFCQPADWGADIIVHSATKWIGGHGTSVGGIAVVADSGSDWESNAARFPRLHGRYPGTDERHIDYYKLLGGKASYFAFLHKDVARHLGSCLSPLTAQQLFVGVESLSLRCQRQAQNAEAMAAWLRAHPRVAWVQYLGDERHPSHRMARKYLQRGFGTVLNFGVRGGGEEAERLVDGLELITNTTNIGDCKTIIGQPWATTHREYTEEVNEFMGVAPEMCRLSLGVEDIQDLIEDFEQAFERARLL
ncbi:lyase [Xylariomycetidae sp. FL2044]|nr:lyase [Xylariomycetidae sp. FL2044]